MNEVWSCFVVAVFGGGADGGGTRVESCDVGCGCGCCSGEDKHENKGVELLPGADRKNSGFTGIEGGLGPLLPIIENKGSEGTSDEGKETSDDLVVIEAIKRRSKSAW